MQVLILSQHANNILLSGKYCRTGNQKIQDVGGDSLLLHGDTYYINIEESDLAKSILFAGEKLGHFHVC